MIFMVLNLAFLLKLNLLRKSDQNPKFISLPKMNRDNIV